MAGIVVPVYLAVLGYHGFLIGILFTATAITSAVLSSLIGWFSDRIGRKIFLITTPLLTSVACLFFAFSQVGAVLFVFAALGSLGRGAGAGVGMIGPYQPAEQAFLAEKVSPGHRNALFGRLGFASSLGAFLGSGPLILLAAFLASGHRHGEYFIEFLLGALLALASGLLALPLHEVARHPRLGQGATRQPRTKLSPSSWKILVRLWATNGLNGLAVGFFGPFLTYWFYRRFGVGPVEIGILYSLINLAAMISNLASARVALRWGIVKAIFVTRILQAILIVPMVLAGEFWLAGALYLVRMMVQRLGLPLRQSYVMGVIPDAERGRVGGLSNLPSQVTSAAGPSFAGYLFEHFFASLPFEIGAALQALNALLFYSFFHSVRPPEEQVQPRTEKAFTGTDHI
jgi:MFS family permease